MSNEFKTYVDKTIFPNHKISISSQKIVIDTIPNNRNIVIDCCFILAVILLSIKFWSSYATLDGILIACAIIATWIDFNAITYFTLDLDQKVVSVIPKNFIKKYILKKKEQFDFNEIEKFYQTEKEAYRSYTRYQVFLSTKNGSPLLITDFGEESQAETIKTYLNLLIN